MTTHLLHDRLTTFLLHLEVTGRAARKDAIAHEVIEAGGTYIAPDAAAGLSHLFEVSLHGVNAYGHDEDEAIRNWTKAAWAICELSPEHTAHPVDLPFPEPRNHQEEIANARAQHPARRATDGRPDCPYNGQRPV